MGIVNLEIQDVFMKYDRILIDTNSFIYFMEDHDVYADLLQNVFDMIESGKVFGVTSTLVLTEVLTKLINVEFIFCSFFVLKELCNVVRYIQEVG